MATLIDFILIPLDHLILYMLMQLCIDMTPSDSDQSVINQGGRPIALVSMVIMLWETRRYQSKAGRESNDNIVQSNTKRKSEQDY